MRTYIRFCKSLTRMPHFGSSRLKPATRSTCESTVNRLSSGIAHLASLSRQVERSGQRLTSSTNTPTVARWAWTFVLMASHTLRSWTSAVTSTSNASSNAQRMPRVFQSLYLSLSLALARIRRSASKRSARSPMLSTNTPPTSLDLARAMLTGSSRPSRTSPAPVDLV